MHLALQSLYLQRPACEAGVTLGQTDTFKCIESRAPVEDERAPVFGVLIVRDTSGPTSLKFQIMAIIVVMINSYDNIICFWNASIYLLPFMTQ